MSEYSTDNANGPGQNGPGNVSQSERRGGYGGRGRGGGTSSFKNIRFEGGYPVTELPYDARGNRRQRLRSEFTPVSPQYPGAVEFAPHESAYLFITWRLRAIRAALR